VKRKQPASSAYLWATESSQVKSSIRLLCKCQRKTDYILIIAVTDASMIYREDI